MRDVDHWVAARLHLDRLHRAHHRVHHQDVDHRGHHQDEDHQDHQGEDQNRDDHQDRQGVAHRGHHQGEDHRVRGACQDEYQDLRGAVHQGQGACQDEYRDHHLDHQNRQVLDDHHLAAAELDDQTATADVLAVGVELDDQTATQDVGVVRFEQRVLKPDAEEVQRARLAHRRSDDHLRSHGMHHVMMSPVQLQVECAPQAQMESRCLAQRERLALRALELREPLAEEV